MVTLALVVVPSGNVMVQVGKVPVSTKVPLESLTLTEKVSVWPIS